MINARDMRADRFLTDFSIGCAPDPSQSIAQALCPTKVVDAYPSGYIASYNRSDWSRNEAKEHSPRTEGEGSTYGVGNISFLLRHYSHFDEFDRDDLMTVESPFEIERTKTKFVTTKLWLKREIECASTFFGASIYSTEKTGGTTAGYDQWQDLNADIPRQVSTLGNDVELACGVEPNLGVIGKGAFAKARWSPSLVDLIKYTQRGVITEDLFASLCGIPRLLVGRPMKTTSVRGTAEASATFARIWGNHFLLAYSPTSLEDMTPAVGVTITHRVANQTNAGVNRSALQLIERHQFPHRNQTTRIQAHAWWQMKLLNADAGGIITGVTD